MKNLESGIICLTVLCALCLNGCVLLAVGAGAGIGAGTYAYVKGALEAAYPASYQETWSATLAALDALELRKMSASKDAIGGQIQAARADGTSIKIKVTPITASSTLVKIRVGMFGNRPISEMISSEIENRLKT